MGGWNRISSAGGLLKPLAGVPFASMPGAGAAYFLVGSALGVFAMLHASESEVGREWAFAARLAALYRSVGAHYVLDVMSFLLLAAKVWRLGKRCDVVEGLVGGSGPHGASGAHQRRRLHRVWEWDEGAGSEERQLGPHCGAPPVWQLLRQACFEVAGF
uniref:Uncharacterized protein n=1 Tax=Triticum urartu TaxID=4572 RepID=A0A8R7TK27_TRIUA